MVKYVISNEENTENYLKVEVTKIDKCLMFKTFYIQKSGMHYGPYMDLLRTTQGYLKNLYEEHKGDTIISVGYSLMNGRFILSTREK